MSFMDTLFGGTDDSGQKAQEKANQLDRELFAQNAAQGRNDTIRLFDTANQNLRSNTQGAMDIFSQIAPAQTQQFQDGNVAAQEALLAGLPQIQNALMGLPVDLTGLQPTRINADTSYANQQLPQYLRPGLTKIKTGGS